MTCNQSDSAVGRTSGDACGDFSIIIMIIIITINLFCKAFFNNAKTLTIIEQDHNRKTDSLGPSIQIFAPGRLRTPSSWTHHLGAAPFFNMSLCLSLQFVHAAILRTIRLTTCPCLPQAPLLPIDWWWVFWHLEKKLRQQHENPFYRQIFPTFEQLRTKFNLTQSNFFRFVILLKTPSCPYFPEESHMESVLFFDPSGKAVVAFI